MYDELVKTIRKQCSDMDCGNCNTCVKLKAADAIEELQQTAEHYHICMNEWFEAAQEYKAAVPKWISATEQLPDDYVSVLCYCSTDGKYGYGECSQNNNGTVFWYGLNGMKPTHWMPLPQPPKE